MSGPISKLLLAKLKNKMEQKKKTNEQTNLTLDGMMTFGVTECGRRILDFNTTEFVEKDAFTANCKVQAMHDGNVYITELPKRLRNKPIFREDNSSLSIGRNGKYYFFFALPEEQAAELPKRLTEQARAIVKKFINGREGKEARV